MDEPQRRAFLPMTTLAELVLDVPIENIVEMPVESVFDPTDPKNSY